MEELLKLKEKDIYINKDLSVNLTEQTLFTADGSEGLHLWEASVILSRYCLQNEIFLKNNRIRHRMWSFRNINIKTNIINRTLYLF